MNVAEAINSLCPPRVSPVLLAAKCPWCGADLKQGIVLATFLDGECVAISQAWKIGRREYSWSHGVEGCHVPQLRRISPSR